RPGARPAAKQMCSCHRYDRRGGHASAGGVGLAQLAPVQARLNERLEERMSGGWLRFELGMALHRQEPRMVPQLNYLDQFAIRARAGDDQPIGLELLPILIVELIAVPVPFVNEKTAIGLVSPAAFLERAGVRPQPHRPALVHNRVLLIEQADDRMAAMGVD